MPDVDKDKMLRLLEKNVGQYTEQGVIAKSGGVLVLRTGEHAPSDEWGNAQCVLCGSQPAERGRHPDLFRAGPTCLHCSEGIAKSRLLRCLSQRVGAAVEGGTIASGDDGWTVLRTEAGEDTLLSALEPCVLADLVDQSGHGIFA